MTSPLVRARLPMRFSLLVLVASHVACAGPRRSAGGQPPVGAVTPIEASMLGTQRSNRILAVFAILHEALRDWGMETEGTERVLVFNEVEAPGTATRRLSNAFDAERGLEAGLISKAQRDAIAKACSERRLTPQHTKLGSGIGLHGWIDAWSADAGTNLSWGCVVMRNDDIKALYRELPLGTLVVMLE